MLVNKRKTPLQYWKSDGTAWSEPQKIPLRVFSMSASSAASQKNFSTFGFIHSKHCNCLSDESVEKLVFVKTKYNALVGSDCVDGSAANKDESSGDDDEITESNSND